MNTHEAGITHFLFLQNLINDGIREGFIRDIDPSLLLWILTSSISGLIARAYPVKDQVGREKLFKTGSISSLTG